MTNISKSTASPKGRRAFLQQGLAVAGTLALGSAALAQGAGIAPGSSDRLAATDAAILRFVATAEIIESDMWQQYTELGGIQNNGA